jgi:hypothetical protein
MTVYAWKTELDDALVTAIVAGDYTHEFDRFAAQFPEDGSGENFTNAHITEPLENMMNGWGKLRRPVLVLTHSSEEQRDVFIASQQLTVVQSNQAIDRQYNMICEEEEAAAEAARKADKRTIAEITGTAENDRWDRQVSENDMSVMTAAPKNITGQGNVTTGTTGELKKTKEQIEREQQEAIESGLGVRKIGVDADGNVEVDIDVFNETDRKRVADMRREALDERAQEKQRIRDAAAAVGLDADAPDTQTGVQRDGTVVQVNKRLGTLTTVFTNGTRVVKDLSTGEELSDIDLKRKELEAQIKELGGEPQPKQEEAPQRMNPSVKVNTHSGETIEEETDEEETDEGASSTSPASGSGQINRDKPKKSEIDPEDYYFAVCPPGFRGDEIEAILGQASWVVIMLKKDFDEGKLPTDKGGWFDAEQLETIGLSAAPHEVDRKPVDIEEVENSIYRFDCGIGDTYRALRNAGCADNGKLLIALGLDVDTVPFTWPYQYKKNGMRKTQQDLYVESCRILQAARDQGVKLADEAGELGHIVADVDHGAIAPAQQDITAELKKLLNAEGTTEESTKACELAPGEGVTVRVDMLPEDVRAVVTSASEWEAEALENTKVFTPDNLPFLRNEGVDLYVLPEFSWDAYCEIKLVGTTNLQELKSVTVGGGPSATVYKKADANAKAIAVYCYREEPSIPWIVML